MKKILIIGSCVSRDVFILFGNREDITFYSRTSMTVFSTEGKLDLIHLESEFQKKCITNEMNRALLDEDFSKYDKIIIDLVDERFNLIEIDGVLYTKSNELITSNFLQDKKYREILFDSEEKEIAFKIGANKIIDKITLSNKVEDTYILNISPGNKFANGEQKLCKTDDKIVKFHQNNYKLFNGFNIITPYSTLLNEEHTWGSGEWHFIDDVYKFLYRSIFSKKQKVFNFDILKYLNCLKDENMFNFSLPKEFNVLNVDMDLFEFGVSSQSNTSQAYMNSFAFMNTFFSEGDKNINRENCISIYNLFKNYYDNSHKYRFKMYDHCTGERAKYLSIFYLMYYELLLENEKRQLEKYLIELFDFLIDDNNITMENNHGFLQIVGLLHLSEIFEDKNSYDHANEILEKMFNSMFSNSGIHLENSTGYHDAMLRMFESLSICVNEINFVDENILQKGKQLYKVEEKRFFRGDSSYFGNLDYQQIEYENLFFKEGLFIGKINNFDFSFISGYPSTIHKHNDDISFTISKNGKFFFADLGGYKYDYTEEEAMFRLSSFAHNSVIVNDEIYGYYSNEFNKAGIFDLEIFEHYSSISGYNFAYNNTKLFRNIIFYKESIIIVDKINSKNKNNIKVNFSLMSKINKINNHKYLLENNEEHMYLFLDEKTITNEINDLYSIKSNRIYSEFVTCNDYIVTQISNIDLKYNTQIIEDAIIIDGNAMKLNGLEEIKVEECEIYKPENVALYVSEKKNNIVEKYLWDKQKIPINPVAEYDLLEYTINQSFTKTMEKIGNIKNGIFNESRLYFEPSFYIVNSKLNVEIIFDDKKYNMKLWLYTSGVAEDVKNAISGINTFDLEENKAYNILIRVYENKVQKFFYISKIITLKDIDINNKLYVQKKEKEVKYKYFNNNSKKLIIIFSSVYPIKDLYKLSENDLEKEVSKRQSSFSWYGIKDNQEFDYLFIEDSLCSPYGWYIFSNNSITIEIYNEFINNFCKNKYENVTTFGTSKGGTAALLYGCLNDYVDNIFIGVPQFDVIEYIEYLYNVDPFFEKQFKDVVPKLKEKKIDKVFDDLFKDKIFKEKRICFLGTERDSHRYTNSIEFIKNHFVNFLIFKDILNRSHGVAIIENKEDVTKALFEFIRKNEFKINEHTDDIY